MSWKHTVARTWIKASCHNFPKRATPEELNWLISEINRGSLKARNRLIEAHMRLAAVIVGTYVWRYGSDAYADEWLSAACEGLTVATDKLFSGAAKCDNVPGYLAEYIHSYISKALDEGEVVNVPGSTRRTARLKGKEIHRPKIRHLNAAERTNYDSEIDPDAVQKQGWWRDSRKRQSLTEDDLREVLDGICQNNTEREIVKLRFDYVDGKPTPDRKIAECLGLNHTSIYLMRQEIAKRLRKALAA